VACIVLPAAVVYDVFWVFIQPLLTRGPSVMVEVRKLLSLLFCRHDRSVFASFDLWMAIQELSMLPC